MLPITVRARVKFRTGRRAGATFNYHDFRAGVAVHFRRIASPETAPENFTAARRPRGETIMPTRISCRRAPRAPALCGLLCLLLTAAACGEKAVTSVPTEPDAIEILDVLGQNGIEAEKRAAGEAETRRWEIVVDEGMFGGGEAALAVQVMRDHGLPRPEER